MSLHYVKEQILIGLKTLKEYKVNIYMGVLAHSGYTLTTFLFILIFSQSILEIPLTTSQLFFYIMYAQFFTMLGGSLRAKLRLSQELKSGNLNMYLTKPINAYIQYVFSNMIYYTFVFAIIDFILLLFIYFTFDITFTFIKLLFVVIISCIGLLFFITIYRLFDMLAFFIKENRFLYSTYNQIDNIAYKFPLLFSYKRLENIVYLIGVFLYGILPCLYLFNSSLITLEFLLKVTGIQLLLSLIFIFLIILCYNKGIKKYEAFS